MYNYHTFQLTVKTIPKDFDGGSVQLPLSSSEIDFEGVSYSTEHDSLP